MHLPTNDLLFKKMLTDKGNEDIAAGFINDLFDVNVKVTPLVPYDVQVIYDAWQESKIIRTEVDFICETQLGERFIIELQVEEQPIFRARALYYLCSRFCGTHNIRNLNYNDLKAVKMMCLLGFSRNIKKKPYRIERYTLQNEEGEEYEAKFLDLRVFEYCQSNLSDSLSYISKFLLEGRVSSDFPNYLQKAAKVVEDTNLSEKERLALRMYETLEQRIAESKRAEREKIKIEIDELLDKGYSAEQVLEKIKNKVAG